ncbi:hypothetical protein ONQ20_21715 [Salmonella enterica subsp. enterica serovar Cerro]|nr:hypothetical protein E5A26_21940 [Salmonella enterica subsp. enterica serovar Cerro]KAA6720833.1 hypothetical protein E5A23_21955 [Salmonella enterica subsp. enterica serovar Cerro]KAA6721342.1 hypothetical protein E5A25_21970 [Salmonella enterica subsp. enterica serovar Cerro]KAA6732249.1 hypothetical protein E5A24_22135 [Salmonella enterica subsp. enterica serovar Cerro]KAA6791284.1 hypothetical protein E5A13_22235 [Salmonella enterica subsp. enterica serovar Cerro]
MTNQEYEAACVTAAKVYDRFEGQHKLRQIDEHIAQVEKTLVSLQEMRREIVNQYNLNKQCRSLLDHSFDDFGRCTNCGKRVWQVA